MYINSIYWLSEEAREAKLEITDGIYTCLAFAHPSYFKIGDKLEWPLRAVNCKNVMIANRDNFYIKPINKNGLEHIGCGKITNKKFKMIAIGNISIQLDNLPQDIKDGDFVEFKCFRLDVKPFPQK